MIKDSILETIGKTPLVRLSRLFRDAPQEVLAKLEAFNPGGSAKDRPAKHILEQALTRGQITRSTTIIESSSGNMAIGLAQFCALQGMRFICVLDVKSSVQNRKILEAYGATLEMVKTPDPISGEFLQARLQRVEQLRASLPDSFWPNQYANPDNSGAHRATTARETFEDGGDIDYVFCTTSTCGTINGYVSFIREHGLDTRVIAVDAVGSVIFGGEKSDRYLPGMGAGLTPPLCPETGIERCLHVTDLECVEGCHKLLSEEAIFSGASSGGVVSAVLRILPELPPQARCVMVLADRGERYLDTVYDEDWVRRTLRVEQPVPAVPVPVPVSV